MQEKCNENTVKMQQKYTQRRCVKQCSAEWKEVEKVSIPLWLWFSFDGSLLTLVTASYSFCNLYFSQSVNRISLFCELYFSDSDASSLIDHSSQWWPHVTSFISDSPLFAPQLFLHIHNWIISSTVHSTVGWTGSIIFYFKHSQWLHANSLHLFQERGIGFFFKCSKDWLMSLENYLRKSRTRSMINDDAYDDDDDDYWRLACCPHWEFPSFLRNDDASDFATMPSLEGLYLTRIFSTEMMMVMVIMMMMVIYI